MNTETKTHENDPAQTTADGFLQFDGCEYRGETKTIDDPVQGQMVV